ncbi:MAG TPA: glucokinase [Rhizomicrobium sp.]|nr:glucokinase [Rhizomicrobium sp.]
MPAAIGHFGLVADIGGTHARFARVDAGGRPGEAQSFPVADYPNVFEAARAYLGRDEPEALVFAVAGPVTEGRIHFTNSGWVFSEGELREQLGVRHARLINDFEAQARAVAHLPAQALVHLGSPRDFDARQDGTMALVGPGTGLGVGGLVRAGKSEIALVTEGGHASLAPLDEAEVAILEVLMKRFGHVSAERVLSGPGLVNLYEAMSETESMIRTPPEPSTITEKARRDPASFEGRVFARFCAMLGSVAGDVALTMGARSGVLIAGGILPDMVELFQASDFRKRFEAKGRFADYMKAIPTLLIVEPNAGLIGAGAVLASMREI